MAAVKGVGMGEDMTAMERLYRELMDHVVFISGPDDWCEEHGMDAEHTTYAEDTERARADIERRIEEARLADGGIEPYAFEDVLGWRSKAAELDALCWPMYEDGTLVQTGDEVQGGTEREVRVSGNTWSLVGEDGLIFDFGGRHKAVRRPEPPDIWERIEEDSRKYYTEYWRCVGVGCSCCPSIVDGKRPRERYECNSCQNAMAIDLVRRARALAGAGDGE